MKRIDFESLAGWGEERARSIPITGTVSGKKTAKALRRAMEQVTELAKDPEAPAWYGDNEYLVRREGALALHSFRHAGRLRKSRSEPALVALCRSYMDSQPITEEGLEAFLTGARRQEAMPESEAALLADGLRLVIIHALAQGVEAEQAGKLFTGLRTLAELDLTGVMERSDPVDRLLRQDEVYPAMDEATRGAYRRRCQTLSRKHGCSVLKQAQTALDEGLHTYLMGERERRGWGYMAAHVLLTLMLSVGLGLASGQFWVAFLGLLPLSEVAASLINGLLLALVQPRRLCRMACENGVGAEGRTVCAVSALLTEPEAGPALCQRLEAYYLSNRDCGGELLFALLADVPDSQTYPAPGSQQTLEAARQAVEALNARYGGGFYLLTRDPVWNRADRRYRPWERKRGAVLELCRAVCGKPNGLRCLAGDRQALYGVYVLCLDSDTRLTPGGARAMIAAALHPINRPVVENGVVVRGHGIIHPRMSLELKSALATDFARLYGGQGGTDPYGVPTGELFSDLFSRGGFSGKGLIHAQSYVQCLDGVLPEDAVLSHDALEGAYLRGAYQGDVELTDTAPVTAAAWFKRLNRWTRGDWQNLPWLGQRGRALAPIDRWRLFDSVRRSLVAPAALLALGLSLFVPTWSGAGAAALVCLGVEAIHAAMGGLFLPARDAAVRCRSGVLRGLGGALTRFMTRLLLLPWEAFTCAGAAITALWRMLVSRKNMLQWVTAAQTSGENAAPVGLWLSIGLGLLLIVGAPGVGGKTLGILWLLTPVFAWTLDISHEPKNELTEKDRDFLRQSAQGAWEYFSQLCTRQEHWLPPDNIQIQPPKGIAHRTSPTNIGLAMAAAVGAMELKAARQQEALELIENILDTVEQLPKWRGHLYNWYDTTTCAPMQPTYVSTVDSGNLCACLIAVSHALEEKGRPESAQRALALAQAMEFDALYDGKRKLFYIGLDPVTEKPSPGHYDLMASEARLTSYLACAMGQVPLRHWQSLSRAQLSLDGWRGMASWSGSMFEYLMPELFLPMTEGSRLWETGRFCLYAQRQRGRKTGAPWGNSESAFFSLDGSMDYRYKAHGTGALALRRDMDSELVIAPYASFLALAVHPKAAVKNLRRLRSMGMWGRFGFYEALDMTPGRTGAKGQPVECFMSHHVGMSLCAIANCLENGVMRRYFMAQPEQRAYQSLLAERVPLGGPVLRRSRSPLTRPPEPRSQTPVFSLEGGGFDPDSPVWMPLANGVYSLLLSVDGTAKAQTGGLLMYDERGLSLAVDGQMLTPSRQESFFPSWRYEAGTVTFTPTEVGRGVSVQAAVAAGEPGELRRITGPSGGRLTVTFTPVLAPARDQASHPAFWHLGLEVTTKKGAIFVRRLYRAGLPEVWLCLMATVPLTIAEGAGWQMLEPVTAQATLPEGGCAVLSLCFGRSRQSAYEGAKRILTGSGADMPGAMASLLGMNGGGIGQALRLCSTLETGRVQGECQQRQSLWQHGISGDLPLGYVSAAEDMDETRRMIKRHALLTACGQRWELVIDTGEQGDYDKPITAAVEQYLEKYGLLSFLGRPGGIYLVSAPAVQAPSVVMLPPPREETPALPGLWPGDKRGRGIPQVSYLPDGAVSLDMPPLPPRAWSNVISNGLFGYVAADSGIGSMWLENARECPVSPWPHDVMATTGGESLELMTAIGRRSFFARDVQLSCRVIHGFGWTRWEQEDMTLTAFIPQGLRARVFVIEGGTGGYIGWHLPLSMCSDERDSRCVITGVEGECFWARNPRSAYPNDILRAVVNRELSGFTCHTPSWFQGRCDGQSGAGLEPCFGAQWRGGGTAVLVCGYEEESVLRALAEPEAARQALFQVRDGWRTMLGRVHIQTPDEELNRMMNGWAAYQTLSCRIMGRTSLYQSGGAYGFRDQLQDVTNLIVLAPEKAREHMLRCCARQFTQGDVLHWWHELPEGPRGVRTRCSDDLLWLAWALCEYVEKTGDTGFCSQMASWLEASPLEAGEHDRYFTPQTSVGEDTVWEHARRAIACVLGRGVGSHGLLYTGSGDWNDGMDKVGGESLWLTWFFIHVAGRFDALCHQLRLSADMDIAQAVQTLTQAAEGAWDGNWYLRGWWQDGTPLGAAGDSACAIDSLAQSWAAFCPTADRGRVKLALDSCVERLFDPAHGIVKLFDPPFGDEGHDPGYIRACGPGFRENGGQYTHGAVWLCSALLQSGMTQAGAAMLLAMLPGHHDMGQWGAEPYVLAADVSSNADHYGQALWSWYTGSAGWFFRVVLEDLLGIRLREGKLQVQPNLPPDWDGYEAQIGNHKITVKYGHVTIQ